jgi:hypothetical protein
MVGRHFAAMVIDRLCLIMMGLATLLCLVYIVVAAPYLDAG